MHFACFVLFTIFLGSGSSLGASPKARVEITPAKVNEGDGQTVEIACLDVHNDVLMISMKNGTSSPMVYIHSGTRVTVADQDIAGRIQASGLLSKNGQSNFLKVKLPAPLVEDSGTYTCEVAFTVSGVMTMDTASAVLTVEEPEIVTTQAPVIQTTKRTPTFNAESVLYNLLDRLVQIETDGQPRPYWIIGLTDQEREDLMKGHARNTTVGPPDLKAVMDRLAKLESIVFTSSVVGNVTVHDSGYNKPTSPPTTDPKIVQRVDRLEDENKNLSRQIEWLSVAATPDPTAASITKDVLERVKELEDESSKQTKKVATLETKEAYTTAFHVSFNEVTLPMKKGMTLDFPYILSQRGPGFDHKTGVFTAPKDGIYGFHLVIDGTGKGMCKIVLKANNQYVSLLLTGPAHGNQEQGQTSTSAVVDLKKGQQVKAVVIDVEGHVVLKGWGYSTFTGYLIWSK